jgi:hypothetical protein
MKAVAPLGFVMIVILGVAAIGGTAPASAWDGISRFGMAGTSSGFFIHERQAPVRNGVVGPRIIARHTGMENDLRRICHSLTLRRLRLPRLRTVHLTDRKSSLCPTCHMVRHKPQHPKHRLITAMQVAMLSPTATTVTFLGMKRRLKGHDRFGLHDGNPVFLGPQDGQHGCETSMPIL